VRILFLTRSFNSLTQRLYLELTALGHEVAVEFDSRRGDVEACAVRPARRRPSEARVPEAVASHRSRGPPGIVGDRDRPRSTGDGR
jgi:putative two-component system hydrogenase maturation factor HypX/HoxX